MRDRISILDIIQMHRNNFDLIRLFAATQVFIHHLYNILGVNLGQMVNGVSHFLALFPGVPIFFFISGYLISQSFENSSGIKSYFLKRVLRIYPALIASVILGIILIAASGYIDQRHVAIFDWTFLFLTKTTFFQFYNPSFLRSYGDGVFNGNLWTITVELQFYVILVAIFKVKKKTSFKEIHFWAIIMVVSILLNRLYIYLFPHHNEEIWFKLLGVSFAPWFYMFVLGIIAQQYKHLFMCYIKEHAWLIISTYIFFSFLGLHFRVFDYGNHLSPVLAFPLFTVILCFAYKLPSLSQRLLRGQDISYGIYLYHMLIINFFLFHFQTNAKQYTALIIGIVIVTSLISWFFLEKHAIDLKKRFV